MLEIGQNYLYLKHPKETLGEISLIFIIQRIFSFSLFLFCALSLGFLALRGGLAWRR